MKATDPAQLPLGYPSDPAQPVVATTAGTAAATLSAHNLRKKYKKQTVVTDVSFDVAAGEVVGLLGPNGAGKTTCFYMIVDGAGRPNETKLTVWVTGGDAVPQRELTQEQVTIIPDKQTYAVGDTAELLDFAGANPGRITW